MPTFIEVHTGPGSRISTQLQDFGVYYLEKDGQVIGVYEVNTEPDGTRIVLCDQNGDPIEGDPILLPGNNIEYVDHENSFRVVITE